MKKTLTILLSVLLSTTMASAQLLWRVSGNGLAKPSYIVGTYHLAKVSFVDSIPGLRDAMNATEQAYGELNMVETITDPAMTQKVQQSMLMPDGKTIDTVLTPEQYARLNAFLSKMLGTDLENPMLASMKQMSPGALYVQLQALAAMMKEGSALNLTEQFDSYFQQVAQENGKAVGGLETMDQQIEILYGSATPERQVEHLMCFVDNADYYLDVMDRTITAFYSQDLQAIEDINAEKMGQSCDSTPEEDDQLINNRNANWAKALPEIMAAHSTLLAVGVAHLPGEKGLLQLLRAQGYTVEAVK